MDSTTIYSKTAKGLREATGKTRALSRNLRNILKEIDGKKTLGELRGRLGNIQESELKDALSELSAADYIRRLAAHSAQETAPAGDLDFSSLAQLDAPAKESAHDIAAELRAQAAAHARQEAEEKARREAEKQTRQIAEAQARRTAEEKAGREAEEKIKRETEARARHEVEMRERREAEARLKREIEDLAARQEAEKRAHAEEQARREAEVQAKHKAEEQARREAEERAKREAEERARQDAEEHGRQAAEERARHEAEEQAKREAEEQARREAEVQAKHKAEEQARREAEEQAKHKAEEQARREAEEQNKRETEERAKREAEAQAKHEAEERARHEAEEQAKREAEERAKREAEEQARWETEEQRKREAEERAKREAEERARQEAEERTRQAAEEQTKREAEEQAKREAEERAKREAEEQARRETEEQSKREAEERAKREAEEQARREAEEKSRRKAEERAEREARAMAKRQAREQARQEAKEQARRKAEEKAAAKDAGVSGHKRIRWGKVVALGLFALLAAGLGLVSVISFDGRIPELEKAAAAQFGQAVKIDSLRLSLLPRPRWRISGLAIGKEGQIRVPQAEAVLGLGFMSGNGKSFDRVRMDSPVLNEEGLGWLLFGRMGERNFRLGEIKAVNARLDSKNIRLPVFDAKAELGEDGNWRKIKAKFAGGEAYLELEQTGQGARLEISADSFAVPFGSRLVLGSFSATGIATRDDLVLKEFQGRMHDGFVSGSARLKWAETWALDGDIHARQLNPAQIVPGLLGGGRIEGKASYALRARDAGSLFAAPRVEGEFAIEDGLLLGVDLLQALKNGSEGGKTAFSELRGGFVHEGGKTQLRQMRLKAGIVSATGSAEADANRNIRGRIAADLDYSMSRARANLSLSGSLDKPRYRR